MKLLAAFLIAAAATAHAQVAPPLRAPKAIAQPNPSLPAEFKRAHVGETLRGGYKICVATDGTVNRVTTIESIPEVDALIIDHIKTRWRYEATPVPICFDKRFVFKITP